jgi:hypothetical protein
MRSVSAWVRGLNSTMSSRRFRNSGRKCTRISASARSRASGLISPSDTASAGPSYLDPGSGGPENDFTNRNTTFMTWNLLHLARMLKDAGGIPAHGNQRSEWDAGCRFDFHNPEYR